MELIFNNYLFMLFVIIVFIILLNLFLKIRKLSDRISELETKNTKLKIANKNIFISLRELIHKAHYIPATIASSSKDSFEKQIAITQRNKDIDVEFNYLSKYLDTLDEIR